MTGRIPGPKSQALARRLRQVESRNITFINDDFPVFWESGRAAWITDVDGHRYLDFSSAFAVANLGHSPAAVSRSARQQMRKLWHGMGDVHPSAIKVQLLEALRDLTPGNLTQTILSSSGSEAVESALKTARLATGKAGVIAFDGAYHGLGYGALAVTQWPLFRDPFRDQIGRWGLQASFPDALRGIGLDQSLSSVEAFLKGSVIPIGAILVEPIQGRGGVRVPPPGFLHSLSRLAARYDALLIVDEIFTGFGRTGRMFACEAEGVVPDILCIGKGLSNGFPISACIASRRVMDAWPPSEGEAIHTSTFLGNPLGCAMALSTIRELKKRQLAARAHRLGAFWQRLLQTSIRQLPAVAEIRGAGLLWGIELKRAEWTTQVVRDCLQRNLIILSGGMEGNVLTLTPPLTIAEQDLRRGTLVLRDVIQAVA